MQSRLLGLQSVDAAQSKHCVKLAQAQTNEELVLSLLRKPA